MKKFILALLVCCSTQLAFSQDQSCSRTVKFGTTDICLKKVNGYQESYTLPIIKNIADATEVPANIVLGYYINDELYGDGENIDLDNFNDYFKIYATRSISDVPVNKKILRQMQNVVKGNFISKHWDKISSGIDELGFDLEVGKPVIIDSYKVNNESFSFIMLTQYNPEDEEPYTLVMTMNGMILNDRLIWMAYYRLYEDEKSIGRTKDNNTKIMNQLMG